MVTVSVYSRAGRPCRRPVADLLEEADFSDGGELLAYRMLAIQPERRPQGPEDFAHLFIESSPDSMFDHILSYLERSPRDEAHADLAATLKDRYNSHLPRLEQTSQRFARMNALNEAS